MPDPQATATALPPKYDPSKVEGAVARAWVEADAFHAEAGNTGKPFSMCIPPPNVTAALHLGHALNNTLQDILARVHRMRGFNTCWLPGTDHAGIATQTVVEKRVLASEGKRRTDFERSAFVAKIQEWKDEYEQRITQQLRQMGCSCDWERQAFTMDGPRTEAVREAFFRLFKDGLIYRGKRLVNWDPVTQTALADDEVEMEDVDGNFYYMRYPLCDAQGLETGEHITVATTRPETMFGDTAVAVNPNDAAERSGLIGRFVKLPIVGRVIPIVGDDYVVRPDPESDDAKARMATGFLKVTPAHDPNDFEIGRRHDLTLINVMAPDASISRDHGWDDAPPDAEASLGLSREDARREVVKWFKQAGLMEKVTPHRHAVGHSYRSHVAIEPYYSDQWYLNVTDDRLAGSALRAMSPAQYERGDASPGDAGTGGLTFHPARYAKTFQQWHENLRDWCISRQLWWGHQIPVWSGAAEAVPAEIEQQEGVAVHRQDGTAFVCLRGDASVAPLEAAGFTRDPDVLDTWFSSALWPMSTLGWPQDNPALETWNPTDTLCTAREIITLWVSRMVMFNRYFRGGDLPFKDVFIHAMIQDGFGQKMSKSLGNGVDPNDIVHSHGADAMRFTLAQMTTHTQDVRLPLSVIDPHDGQAFTPEFITNRAGYKVVAPVLERNGRRMTSSYGAASGEAQPTDDAPLARNTSDKFDLGQRFANKIWNATRFALEKLEGHTPDAEATAATDLPSRWILGRLSVAQRAADDALARYHFADYTTALYDFFWRDLCDWYIEAVKPTVADQPSQRATLAAALDAGLRLLHPVMPFITERLFEALNHAVPDDRSVPGLTLTPSRSGLLCHAPVPRTEPQPGPEGPAADPAVGFQTLQQLITAVRNARTRYKIPPRQRVTVTVVADEAAMSLLDRNAGWVSALAGLELTQTPPADPAEAAEAASGPFRLQLHGLADRDVEAERSGKRRGELEQQIQRLRGRLSNESYVAKAPVKLVDETRSQLAAAEAELAAL